MNYSTMTRLTDLLEEIRRMRDLIGIRPVNVVVDGKVQHSGQYEYYCQHCTADPHHWYESIDHKPECIMSRIDAAVAAAMASKGSA